MTAVIGATADGYATAEGCLYPGGDAMGLVAGLDTGLVATGLVLVDCAAIPPVILRHATLRTERQAGKRGLRVADDDARRASELAVWLGDRLAGAIGVVAELPTAGAQGARANRSMGLSTGVVVATVALAGLPAEWTTPGDGKRAATGRRDGSKADVQAAVSERFVWAQPQGRYAWEREHVCDAAAAVLAAWEGTLVRLARRSASEEVPRGRVG